MGDIAWIFAKLKDEMEFMNSYASDELLCINTV